MFEYGEYEEYETTRKEVSLFELFQAASEIFKNRFLTVFPPDGMTFHMYKEDNNKLDKIKVGGDSFEEGDIEFTRNRNYATHPLTIISHFLGLPNRRIGLSGQSLTNLFYNFTGWQHRVPHIRVPGYKKALNLLLVPFNMAWHLINMPFKAALNIAKLVTEFLPLSLNIFLEKAFAHFDNDHQDEPVISKLRDIAAGLVLLVAWGMSFPLVFLGKAITSPINQMNSLYKWANKKYEGWIGKTIGWALAGVSFLATISLYSVLFPVAAHLIATSVLPYAAAHLPASIVNAANVIATTLAPTLTAVGSFMAPIAASALHYMTFLTISTAIFQSAVMGSAAMCGLGTLFALGLATAETVVAYVGKKSVQLSNTASTWVSSKLRNVRKRTVLQVAESDLGSDLKDKYGLENVVSGKQLERGSFPATIIHTHQDGPLSSSYGSHRKRPSDASSTFGSVPAPKNSEQGGPATSYDYFEGL